MNGFDYYRNRVLSKGSNEKDIIINERTDDFSEHIKTAPNTYMVKIGNGYYDVIIQDVKFNQELKDDKYLIAPKDNTISVGDYVDWDGQRFIITTKEIETIKTKQSFRMSKCNHVVSWIDDNDKLITRDVVLVVKTLYTPGVNGERHIEYGDALTTMVMPFDEETKTLNRGVSFIFNKSKYKITFFNEVENKGVIHIICKEEVYNQATDDIENGIADRYIDGIDRLAIDNTEDDTTATMMISGADIVTWDNSEIYTVKNSDGTDVSGNTFEFTIDNTDLATLSTIDEVSCSVYGIMRKRGFVTLRAVDSVTGIDISKVIEIKGLI